jgi:lauroyl/myristoyl acyltransferase
MAVIPDTRPIGRATETTVYPRPPWYGHRLNRPSAYRLTAAIGAGLPRALRLRLAAAIAPRLRALFAAEWQVVLGNVGRIMPTASVDARQALAVEVFRHFAMCFSDLVVTNRRRQVRGLLGRLDGELHFATAARTGRGLIVLTAHLGNWELGGRLVAESSARPTHVVVQAEPNPRLESFLRGGPAPVRFVARRHPTDVLGLMTALRRGEVVAMQGDRAIGTRGDVPAFAHPSRRSVTMPVSNFSMLPRASRWVPSSSPGRRERQCCLPSACSTRIGVTRSTCGNRSWSALRAR